MKLLIHPAIDEARFQSICAAAPELAVVNAVEADQAQAEIVDADAFFGKLTPQLLAAAGRLRWVQSPTASLEHYLFPALIAHGCVLTNMRGLFSDIIADQVMGYVICLARNLHTYIRQQAQHVWAPVGGEDGRVNFAQGPGVVGPIDRAHLQLSRMTMGIVGLGAIGGELAKRASAFGMRVIAVDPMRTEKPPEVDWLRSLDSLTALLQESDVVVVAAPHTPATERMFSAPQFQQMKATAYFINIGRGAIVSLDDLTAALQSGEIAGAALDVYETEPLPPEHPLWDEPNVILTPHVAGYAPCIAERHLAIITENARRFQAGQPLRNVVDKQQWF